MKNFWRFLFAIILLPTCWGMSVAIADCIVVATGGETCFWESIAMLGGILSFTFCWFAMPRFMKTYILGHELTHALWGLFFGAKPSRLRVSNSGGSVNLSKTNLLISLAPYFFPFYTFVVAIIALITFCFIRPLPWLPLWTFLVGFTWTFHILFTLETLTKKQPDLTPYGRLFSWVFIYIANLLLVLIWLATMTPVSFSFATSRVCSRTAKSYLAIKSITSKLISYASRNN